MVGLQTLRDRTMYLLVGPSVRIFNADRAALRPESAIPAFADVRSPYPAWSPWRIRGVRRPRFIGHDDRAGLVDLRPEAFVDG